MAYHREYGITPESIKKSISDVLSSVCEKDYYTVQATPEIEDAGRTTQEELPAYIEQLEKAMRAAAKRLEFERAAELRDRIGELEKRRIGVVEK
jgi:excinuclease ABC subunit B